MGVPSEMSSIYNSPERRASSKSKRLAADFMFPAKIKAKRIQIIQSNLVYQDINVNELIEDAFDSIK